MSSNLESECDKVFCVFTCISLDYFQPSSNVSFKKSEEGKTVFNGERLRNVTERLCNMTVLYPIFVALCIWVVRLCSCFCGSDFMQVK